MSEHPDIADLSVAELSDAVKAHLLGCDVCSQIYADTQLLTIDLKDLNAIADIPDSVNESVYADISTRSRQIRESIFKKKLLVTASAIAAVLILSFSIVVNIKSDKGLVADINGDGEVNVLDTLILAQKIDAKKVDQNNDLNGDGLIDSEDLQIVRNAVVSLDGRLP